jgi:hypothetical protein
VVNEEGDRGDFYGEAGGDFVPGAILGAAGGMDTNVLVGVLVVLVNTRGVREDNCRRNVLLIVKVRERRQGTWRRDRSEREDWVVERGSWAQASVRFCGGFCGGRDVKFSVGEDFYSFSDTVVVYRRRAAVTGGEPVLFRGRLNVDGAVDGGGVIVDGGSTVADGGDWTVGRSDGVQVR